MATVVRTTKRPGRAGRRLARIGLLAAAVAVGRRTAPRGDRQQPREPRHASLDGSRASADGPAPSDLGGIQQQRGDVRRSGSPPGGEQELGRLADTPRQIPRKGWIDIAKRVKTEMRDDRVTLLSAGIAYYGMLSLFPALIAVVSIFGLAVGKGEAQAQINQITRVMPAEARDLIGKQLTQIVSTPGSGLTLGLIIAILAALWSASSGMRALVTGINAAYDEKETRKFLKLRAVSLALTVGAIVVVSAAMGAIVALPVVTRALHAPAAVVTTVRLARWPLLAMLVLLGLAVLYRYGPDRKQPKWQWVSYGSVVATVVWIVASVGFSFYANNFGRWNKTYGTLAGVIVLLIWLFLSAMVVLVGAELNSEMELQTRKDTTEPGGKPMGERDAYAADHVARSTTG